MNLAAACEVVHCAPAVCAVVVELHHLGQAATETVILSGELYHNVQSTANYRCVKTAGVTTEFGARSLYDYNKRMTIPPPAIPPPTLPLPIVQSIPHAGLDAPTEMQDQLLVDATTIYNECDLWADQLYDFTHADLQPWWLPGYAPGVLATVSAPIARVFVDANRERDDLDNPDGPIKTQTSYGEPIYRAGISIEQRRALRDRYWQPFHHQLAAALATHAGQVRLLLDCHNMAQRGPAAYAFAGAARPLICLANLGDETGEPRPDAGATTCPGHVLRAAGEIAADLFADMTLLEPDRLSPSPPPIVMLNWPFVGGAIIRHYGHSTGEGGRPPAIMVEVNRGLFVGDQEARTPIRPPNLARIAEIRQRLYRWATAVVELLP